MRKVFKWAGVALVAVAVGGCAETDTGEPVRDRSSSSQNKPATENPVAADPAATSNLNCDYLLGDFGDSGDPNAGYRFVGGGNIRNTGNVGVLVRVTFRWQQLGTAPITRKKTLKIPYGKGRRVNVTVPATQDQIDLHQSAEGDCSAKATITGKFGTPQS